MAAVAAVSDIKFFRYFEESLSGVLNTYVNSVSSSLASQFVGIAVTACTVYYLMQGYMIMTGRVEQPFVKFMWSSAKFAFIAFLALNASNYLTYIVSAVEGLKTGLTSILSATDGSATSAASAYEALDKKLSYVVDVAAAAYESNWKLAGLRTMGYYFLAILYFVIIGLSGVFIIVPAGAMVVVADMALAMLLAVGPLFIMCLMWPPTARFFEGWLSITIGYILRIALVLGALTLAMIVFTYFLDKTASSVDGQGDNELIRIFVLISAAYALKFLIAEMINVAAGLSGGVSSGMFTISGMWRASGGAASRAAGGAARSIRAGYRGGKASARAYQNFRKRGSAKGS